MLASIKIRLSRLSQSTIDLMIIAAIGVAALALFVEIQLYEMLLQFHAEHEQWEADELSLALLVIGWCGFAFGGRRVMELKKEIRSRKKAELAAHQLATHDSLTALPNRRGLELSFANGLRQLDEPFFVVLFDLDGFKSVNDVHGHAVGDQLLQTIAQRLRIALPEDDFACRLGGDEFALVLRSTKTPTAAHQLIAQLAEIISQPVVLESVRLVVHATYGVSHFPHDGQSLGDLMRRADLALYQGKHSGKHVIRFFDSNTDHHLEDQSRAAQLVREALDNGYLTTLYQPIVSLAEQRVVGFEALARLHHPIYGEIPPTRFIPAAEQSGLIRELTSTLLEIACTDALTWPEHLYLSFNLSALDLQDPDLPERLLAILAKVGFAPARLEVEVTETAIVKDIPLARKHFDALRAVGVLIAIDDFGTGYSSLAQISRFSFDKLKIDREFVSSVCESEKSGKIVRSMIHLSHGLDMPAIAEGIENIDQLDWLNRAGCHYGQGYYFSRAVSAEAVQALLNEAPAGIRAALPAPVARHS
ncbi:EAL domain-containing protein [Stutzerimonas zhaodongensis]|uniref:EAL domain-containing protein n=1 Tax=Stutzerimonas zhaodongensis TaxID=1176257 RepID=A0A3M2I314_9GAMM|nr:EAL domain-containing protein [Stutzerimonas zhaodongensis]MCQ4316852.1 EAL domain-containing protein [Stutzerimonas zhaodongensis]RMH92594.1 EAL domain-containing protein [Stutzerimonas zhaodongensis]